MCNYIHDNYNCFDNTLGHTFIGGHYEKNIVLVFLCFIVISMFGCDGEVDKNTIYDDDNKITKSADSHYSNLSVYNLDGNKFSMTVHAFTGAKTIWTYSAKEDCDIAFLYSLSISDGGNAKLVLITPDNEVIILAENTETDEMQSQTISLKKGNNRIKIVGHDDPNFDLIFEVDVGELVSE